MYWRQQAAVGAVSGQSRGWARPVVETEGPQAEGPGRSGAGSCPQSITRENKQFKKLKILCGVLYLLRRVCGVGRPAPLALLRRACTTSLSRTFCECLLQHSRSPSPLFASYQAFSITAVPAATCCDGKKLPGAP